MAITDIDPSDIEAQVGAYAERLFMTGLAALEAITISLGRQLGLYQHLTGGDVTAAELADVAGIDIRYAREWLEQQASAGLIEVTSPAEEAITCSPNSVPPKSRIPTSRERRASRSQRRAIRCPPRRLPRLRTTILLIGPRT